MTPNMPRCTVCDKTYDETHPKLAEVFGIERRRCVPTGFWLYDSTRDEDVPDMDTCDRDDCPGYHKIDFQQRKDQM